MFDSLFFSKCFVLRWYMPHDAFARQPSALLADCIRLQDGSSPQALPLPRAKFGDLTLATIYRSKRTIRSPSLGALHLSPSLLLLRGDARVNLRASPPLLNPQATHALEMTPLRGTTSSPRPPRLHSRLCVKLILLLFQPLRTLPTPPRPSLTRPRASRRSWRSSST